MPSSAPPPTVNIRGVTVPARYVFDGNQLNGELLLEDAKMPCWCPSEYTSAMAGCALWQKPPWKPRLPSSAVHGNSERAPHSGAEGAVAATAHQIVWIYIDVLLQQLRLMGPCAAARRDQY